MSGNFIQHPDWIESGSEHWQDPRVWWPCVRPPSQVHTHPQRPSFEPTEEFTVEQAQVCHSQWVIIACCKPSDKVNVISRPLLSPYYARSLSLSGASFSGSSVSLSHTQSVLHYPGSHSVTSLPFNKETEVAALQLWSISDEIKQWFELVNESTDFNSSNSFIHNDSVD